MGWRSERYNPNTDLSPISNETNPYKWMRYCDCLIISSKSEASPNVLKEALFLGTSVVSTNSSPIINKLLPLRQVVPVGDCIALSMAMLRIVERNK